MDNRMTENTQNIAAEQLRSIIERVETFESEKADITEDIKQVFAEAKGNGFDTKTIKKIIALRKLDDAERQEADAMLDSYKAALGLE
ncbi:MAG: DUF2312 domain-containing protein [Nitratireductor sp.]|uniref:DUF2312 domain-containing protein n=1 Tax=Nitratireductor sp. TaxID=1872084 RepID=UPI00262B73FB|nr:DUF2312 domain-containing protein [Nitratireductor sp.]MCV0350152.1 DUF2312 domain-containing protein [Nitratireductor sp.]